MKRTEKTRTNLPESTYSQVGAESNVNTESLSMGLTGRISIGSIRLLRSMPQSQYYPTDAYRRQEHHFCTRLRKERLWFSFYILFYFGYLIVGAVTMHIIEVPVQKAKRQDFSELRNNFLEMYPEILGKLSEHYLWRRA